MNIYTQINNANEHNLDKNALSMTMDNGDIRLLSYSTLFHKAEKTAFELL